MAGAEKKESFNIKTGEEFEDCERPAEFKAHNG